MAIGFIGLGIMGSRMAANLLRAGHPLVVQNRTPSKADWLVTNGAAWVDTPAEVGGQSSVLFKMLARPEAVLETAFGPSGFLGELPAGALWVDCSTFNPAFSRRMAAEARELGVRLVDAPVTGIKRPKFESGDHEADFPLQLMWKALHLAALTAYEQGVPLTAGNVAKEIYAMAVKSGLFTAGRRRDLSLHESRRSCRREVSVG